MMTIAALAEKKQKEFAALSPIFADRFFLTSQAAVEASVQESAALPRGVTHLLAITDSEPSYFAKLRTNRSNEKLGLRHVALKDSPDDDLRTALKATDQILLSWIAKAPPSSDDAKNDSKDSGSDDKATNSGESTAEEKRPIVLVHCSLGQSRSASVVLSYMMRLGLPLSDAYSLVKKARPLVRPNDGFMRTLIELDKEQFGKESLTMEQFRRMK